MADEELPTCGICGDLLDEPAKPSPFSGALLFRDCDNEENEPDPCPLCGLTREHIHYDI